MYKQIKGCEGRYSIFNDTLTQPLASTRTVNGILQSWYKRTYYTYCSNLTLSQSFRPLTGQLLLIAALLLATGLETASYIAVPDNIAEAAHQRAGSGSCGHPRRSRQRTGGESANWSGSGPAPAEPSLPPSCQQRAGSGPAPAPDSAGASRIAAGLYPSYLSSIVCCLFIYLFITLIPPLNARVLLLLHGNTCILHTYAIDENNATEVLETFIQVIFDGFVWGCCLSNVLTVESCLILRHCAKFHLINLATHNTCMADTVGPHVERVIQGRRNSSVLHISCINPSVCNLKIEFQHLLHRVRTPTGNPYSVKMLRKKKHSGFTIGVYSTYPWYKCCGNRAL